MQIFPSDHELFIFLFWLLFTSRIVPKLLHHIVLLLEILLDKFNASADDKTEAPSTEGDKYSQLDDASSETSVFDSNQTELSEPQCATSQPAPAAPSAMGGLPLPPNLAASLDPLQLKIEPASPGKGDKITKESFEKPPSSLLSVTRTQDPADPLSSLDPLWTHKKSES